MIEDEGKRGPGCVIAFGIMVVLWTLILGMIWLEATIWKWVWQ